MTIEQLTTLRRGVNGVLLLLSRAIGESFVLRKLELDQSHTILLSKHIYHLSIRVDDHHHNHYKLTQIYRQLQQSLRFLFFS